MSEPLIQISTTFSSKEEGLKLGKDLVQARLVACAQLSGGLTSQYEFGGEFCEDTEYQLTLKTRESLFDKVQQEISQRHSYQTPQITAVRIEKSSPAYREWLLTQTYRD